MSDPLPWCYLNGTFDPIESASVSVLDRGFIFGDAVYEVIPVFDGSPFLLDRHLARLTRSLAAVEISPPRRDDEWRSILGQLIERNGGGNQSVYLQVSRGSAPRDHRIPAGIEPTVVAFSSQLEAGEPRPARAITLSDIRWGRCDIKSTSLLANVLFRREAAAAGADEAILVRGGLVTEGAASNVFVVSGGRIRTPPLSPHILPGITRDFLVEILAGTECEAHETDVTEAELNEASEIWCTSSSREIFPIIELNGKTVGDGRPGARISDVWERYARAKEDILAAGSATS